MTTRRQQKAAATRIGLLEALHERLLDRSLDEIPVKELSDAVGVSQATFFNYYDGKHALLMFYVQLWSIHMAWVARQHDPTDPLGAIEAVFAATAADSGKNPNVLGEIIAYQARTAVVAAGDGPTDADLLRFYPDLDGILDVPRDLGIDGVVLPLLTEAVRRGQLPAHTDVTMALFAVISVFFGAGVLGRQVPDLPLEVLFRRQLGWLWTALRQEPAPG